MVSLEKIFFYFLILNWTGFREVQLTGHLTEMKIYPDFLDARAAFYPAYKSDNRTTSLELDTRDLQKL